MSDPHSPRVEDERLFGRGAYDMKAGVAAALVAAREAAGLGLAGDVVVAAVADEEHASLGVREVVASVSADAAIVTEPTELELVVAHKGFVWSQIEVSGRAAHGSRPHLGVDAIVKSRTGPDRDRRARRDARGALASAGGKAVGPRLADRGRRGALELPGALRGRPGAADGAGRDRGRRRGRAG